MLTKNEKEKYMRLAIEQAHIAKSYGEVPIGCVIVHEGEVIGQGYNRRETDRETSAHAEMMAILEANHLLGNWRLENCQLFVTLEPCTMCAGAIVLARIPEVYFAASDSKSGMGGSIFNLMNVKELNHQTAVESGILEEECSILLKDFFKALRQKKK
ncbi:MAG: tRNA adenosine(34) deaminase TadA [Atopococcus tabaci]|uniref:tRNA-specific adenosine deaminase n=1 Tax=Atopococcus tabaci TaxID=269774 RepID=A0AA43UCK8_9LACT|nr:tRNA adenosine(34) deaminase TadA [Atopococcus tabaci]